ESEYQQRVGGAFRAWGGHMSGFNLVLQPGRRIVQAWRANDWWDDHYSIVTVDLRKLNGGAELRFTPIGVPPHRFDGHSRGGIETYWQPMQELFGGRQWPSTQPCGSMRQVVSSWSGLFRKLAPRPKAVTTSSVPH